MPVKPKSLKDREKSSEALEDDWDSVKRRPAGTESPSEPSLSALLRTVSGNTGVRLTVEGIGPKFTTPLSKTLEDAEDEALRIINHRVRARLSELQNEVTQADHALKQLQKELVELRDMLPYLPAPEPPKPKEPTPSSDVLDDMPF